MGNGKIIVEAELRPTEDEEKVIKAINNVFTYENMEIMDQGEYKVIRCYSNSYNSLRKFHDLLRKQAILDAARSYFLKRVRGNKLQILLHKQALYQGKVSFISWDEESPLGPIKITIESDN
ncbi:MAG: RNA-binding domain-containing protein, partial [Caldisphaera sp.]